MQGSINKHQHEGKHFYPVTAQTFKEGKETDPAYLPVYFFRVLFGGTIEFLWVEEKHGCGGRVGRGERGNKPA